MPNLQAISEVEATHFARELFLQTRDRLSSFEEAAQLICQAVYEYFAPEVALVRVFRLTKWADLPPDLAPQAERSIPQWIVLSGSYGDAEAWRGRRTSVNHKIMSAENATPMLTAALQQAHIDVGDRRYAPLPEAQRIDLGHFFYVPDAVNDPLIPDQAQFVHPYGIHTVLGVGSVFLSRAAYLMVVFTKVKMDQAHVQNLLGMTPFVSTILAAQDVLGKYWAS
jgi:hypothetical protein